MTLMEWGVLIISSPRGVVVSLVINGGRVFEFYSQLSKYKSRVTFPGLKLTRNPYRNESTAYVNTSMDKTTFKSSQLVINPARYRATKSSRFFFFFSIGLDHNNLFVCL